MSDAPDYAQIARDAEIVLAGCCDCAELPPTTDRAQVEKHGREKHHFVWFSGKPKEQA